MKKKCGRWKKLNSFILASVMVNLRSEFGKTN